MAEATGETTQAQYRLTYLRVKYGQHDQAASRGSS